MASLQEAIIGGDVRGAGVHGWHFALESGDPDKVGFYLDATDENIDERLQGDGDAPLGLAVRKNHPQIVSLLIGRGADVNITTKYGLPLLHMAVQKNYEEVATLLLQGGVDVNCSVFDRRMGGTALHQAAGCGHEKMVKLLLDNNVDPLIRNKDGATAYDVACMHNKNACAVALGEVMGRAPLHVAAALGDVHLVSTLIRAGEDIFAKNRDNATPYEVAMEHEKVECANIIAEAMSRVPAPEVRVTESVQKKKKKRGCCGGA